MYKETTTQTIHIIAALCEKTRVIGDSNTLPWYIPEDLARFKRLTTGHPIIMGRKTFDSIGKALPHRTNIIVSRNTTEIQGCLVANSIESALKLASTAPGGEDVFIIGGGTIYEQTLPLADILHLTIIHSDFEGDVYFPEYAEFGTEISREDHLDSTPPFSFVDVIKK